MDISDFVKIKNRNKNIFTPGPGPLLEENILGLGPAFGRGDSEYENTEAYVLDGLKNLSGFPEIIRLQGSGSLALEIMIANFIYGNVLVVDTGYYSDRLQSMIKGVNSSIVYRVDNVPFSEIDSVSGKYDWIVGCVTETSKGSLQNIQILRKHADRLGGKLALDAVASIGLEENHDLADAIAFSSCKGLFGLTGAAFVAYKETPQVAVASFNLSLDTHKLKSMTGPYHAIQSLAHVLPIHSELRAAVQDNKNRFLKIARAFTPLDLERQPLLCTLVLGKVTGISGKAILYKPRMQSNDSIVSHLGEIHLRKYPGNSILDSLDLSLCKVADAQ